jgi:uncharacterized protein YacL
MMTSTVRLRDRLSYSNFVIVGLLLGLLIAMIVSGDTPARGIFIFMAMLVILIGIFMFASRSKPGTSGNQPL